MDRRDETSSHFSQPTQWTRLKSAWLIKYGIFTESEIPKKFIELIKTRVCEVSSEVVCNNLSDYFRI